MTGKAQRLRLHIPVALILYLLALSRVTWASDGGASSESHGGEGDGTIGERGVRQPSAIGSSSMRSSSSERASHREEERVEERAGTESSTENVDNDDDFDPLRTHKIKYSALSAEDLRTVDISRVVAGDPYFQQLLKIHEEHRGHIIEMNEKDEEWTDCSFLITEEGKVVGGFLGYVDELDKALIGKRLFLRTGAARWRPECEMFAVASVIQKSYERQLGEIKLCTTSEDTVLTEALGRFGFDLIEHNTETTVPVWTWRFQPPPKPEQIPYIRQMAVDDLNRKLKELMEGCRILGVSDVGHDLSEQELIMAYPVTVVSLADASAVEKLRAHRMLHEFSLFARKSVEGLHEKVEEPGAICFVASSHPNMNVTGVVTAHREDDVIEVDFLGADHVVEKYSKGKLLAELLSYGRKVGAERVRLRDIPEEDIGTIGIAVSMGFRVRARPSLEHAKPHFDLERSCRRPVRDLNNILRALELQGRYRALEFYSQRNFGVGALVQRIFTAVKSSLVVYKEEFDRRIALSVSQVLALLVVTLLALQVMDLWKWRKKQAYARRLKREMKYEGDGLLSFESIATGGVAVPDGVEVAEGVPGATSAKR